MGKLHMLASKGAQKYPSQIAVGLDLGKIGDS